MDPPFSSKWDLKYSAKMKNMKRDPNCPKWIENGIIKLFRIFTIPTRPIVGVNKISKDLFVNNEEKNLALGQTHRNRTSQEDDIKVRQPYKKRRQEEDITKRQP